MLKTTKSKPKKKTSATPVVRKEQDLSVEDLDLMWAEAVISNGLVEDQYWHRRIQRAFEAAGFETRRLEHEEAHPIWQAWLTQVTFNLAPEQRTAVKQLRKILLKGGIKVAHDEFNIIDRRGNKLRCVFLLDLGYAGVLQHRPVPA